MAMARIGGSRAALRSLAAPHAHFAKAPLQRPFASQIWTAATKRPQALVVPRPLMIRQMADKSIDNINLKEEAKIAAKKLTPHPELVSLTSSTHGLKAELGEKQAPNDTDMLSGIKQDLKTIEETFSLKDVPREAYWIGMAGVLPYLATSLSTVYCAYEINSSATHGTGLLLSDKQAELFLHVLEPLQIGYGAAIISFLGAIHWGLEFAGYGGYHGYPRYAIGVAAAGLAWPTILLPAEYALISQFLIFNFLYYTDSRATRRGWTPPWYGVYRFVLTFIVGSAIVVSLIGRGQIADLVKRPNSPAERIQKLRDSQAENLEAEEAVRRQKTVKDDEKEDDEEEEEADEDEEK
ncbi:hypothetical protein AMS68_004224 [Peltaster fructicola]|uniref:MNN4-regulates the mannosylphosphorylation n=1 Tax=Peltaster fructicola TaxID=286661 RepID=A0A6H0XVC5_9PEZI|nr:hypothetical protein AMS68_004224 [Peltaster fructicola]